MAKTVVDANEAAKAELIGKMQEAVVSGDWKLVTTLSREIGKFEADIEKLEQDVRLALVVELESKVQFAIMDVLRPLYQAGDLDNADGVWFSWDFGDQASGCRLLKSQPKAKGGGGGAGKRIDVDTKDMLVQFGTEVFNAETGQTYQQAHDSNTNGNFRYNLRCKLLKLAGHIE